jgi:hypothetical protein
MKKLAYLFLAFAVIGISVLSSCKKEDSGPTDPNPRMSLINTAGYTFQDASFAVGSPFKIGVRCASSEATTTPLASLNITQNFQGKLGTAFDTTFSVSTFSRDFEYVTQAVSGQETWTITLKDASGYTVVNSFIITTTP